MTPKFKVESINLKYFFTDLPKDNHRHLDIFPTKEQLDKQTDDNINLSSALTTSNKLIKHLNSRINNIEPILQIDEKDKQQFPKEKDLQHYLANNISSIMFKKRHLKLFIDKNQGVLSIEQK